MIDGERIREWSDEAAAQGDLLLAVLLLNLSTLYNVGDYRAVELAKNFTNIRAREAVAAHREEDWQVEIPG